MGLPSLSRPGQWPLAPCRDSLATLAPATDGIVVPVAAGLLPFGPAGGGAFFFFLCCYRAARVLGEEKCEPSKLPCRSTTTSINQSPLREWPVQRSQCNQRPLPHLPNLLPDARYPRRARQGPGRKCDTARPMAGACRWMRPRAGGSCCSCLARLSCLRLSVCLSATEASAFGRKRTEYFVLETCPSLPACASTRTTCNMLRRLRLCRATPVQHRRAGMESGALLPRSREVLYCTASNNSLLHAAPLDQCRLVRCLALVAFVQYVAQFCAACTSTSTSTFLLLRRLACWRRWFLPGCRVPSPVVRKLATSVFAWPIVALSMPGLSPTHSLTHALTPLVASNKNTTTRAPPSPTPTPSPAAHLPPTCPPLSSDLAADPTSLSSPSPAATSPSFLLLRLALQPETLHHQSHQKQHQLLRPLTHASLTAFQTHRRPLSASVCRRRA